MRAEILALLSEGKTLSQYDLAKRLNTTTKTVAAHIDFLHRTGYLRKVCTVKNCGKQCAGCRIANAALGDAPVVWEMVKREHDGDTQCHARNIERVSAIPAARCGAPKMFRRK
jgi:biotin operon repressor